MRFMTDFGTGNMSLEMVQWYEIEDTDFETVCDYAQAHGIQDFSRSELFELFNDALYVGRWWDNGGLAPHNILTDIMVAILDKDTRTVANLLHRHCPKW